MTESLRLHRSTIRLPDFDYTSAGAYFITIGTHGHICLFGEITERRISLNSFGDIVRIEWLRTPDVRPEIILDEFVIMPNHLHGIIFITEPVRAHGIASTTNNGSGVGAHGRAPLLQQLTRPPKSLGSFVAGFKSAVTERINILRSTPGMPVWQRNYYEHVIRDDDDLARIREYIRTNPLQWENDREYHNP